jgi:hypothetical protein
MSAITEFEAGRDEQRRLTSADFQAAAQRRRFQHAYRRRTDRHDAAATLLRVAAIASAVACGNT